MKIYLDASDGLGWAIDDIRNNLIASNKRLNSKLVKNPIFADIIHNVWWNELIPFYKRVPFSLKKVLPTAVNFIDLDDESYDLREQFYKVNKIAAAWISPSTKQQKALQKHNIKSFVLPYSVDFELFPAKKETKEEIFKKYNIPNEAVRNRVIMGSFQRDSLGSNLLKPKWQKGPELLIDILKEMPKDKFILLLAGPRRHYVINECKKYNIPYYYVGKETNEDDLRINAVDISQMSDLYSLCDLYLITSKSEGGPKAVLEGLATNIAVFSTDVGFAGDFIKKEYIFEDKNAFAKGVYEFLTNDSFRQKAIEDAKSEHENLIKELSYSVMDKRLDDIYKQVKNGKIY